MSSTSFSGPTMAPGMACRTLMAPLIGAVSVRMGSGTPRCRRAVMVAALKPRIWSWRSSLHPLASGDSPLPARTARWAWPGPGISARRRGLSPRFARTGLSSPAQHGAHLLP